MVKYYTVEYWWMEGVGRKRDGDYDDIIYMKDVVMVDDLIVLFRIQIYKYIKYEHLSLFKLLRLFYTDSYI